MSTRSELLGFDWSSSSVWRDAPEHSLQRATFRFKHSLPEYVWDAAVLEGNPYTYPEVQTLMDGVTVGGHRLSDERQILNLADAANFMVNQVTTGTFALGKPMSDRIHVLIARDEALESGHFRGEGSEVRLTPGVSLGEYGRYLPPPTEPGGANLRMLYERGLNHIESEVDNRFEQAGVYFLFCALQQFYFDGNKRTGRYMMNGHLLSAGIDSVSVPAARRGEFNQLMVDFYQLRAADPMLAFLASCHPDGPAS